MNRLCICAAALMALAVSGCAGDYGGGRGTYRGSGSAIAPGSTHDIYDMSYDERHRTWWDQHRPDVNYERMTAQQEHRRFCERHPDDPSCIGWFQP